MKTTTEQMRSDVQLLTDAQNEIQSLRRRNEILAAKMEMVDLFACVLFSKPAERLETAGICVASALAERIAQLQEAVLDAGRPQFAKARE